MPFTDAQKRLMDIHLRSNTIYHWHAFGTDSTSGRGYIVNTVEQVVDCKKGCRRDLFLPNCFIDGCGNSAFWFKMASIVCCYEGMGGWHQMEFGAPLSREDLHQRYVYTWVFKGETYRFYTKTLNDGYFKELVWYVSKSTEDEEDIDSSDDTDEEDVVLLIHP